MDFWDILIDLFGHFLGGPKWHFSDFKCTFGVSGFRGSVGGPGDCNSRIARCRGATGPLWPDDPYRQTSLIPTRFWDPFWPDFDLTLSGTQACVYPRCGLTHWLVSGKAPPLPGARYLVDTPPPSSSSQGICGAAGQTLCVSIRWFLSRESHITRYIANP